MSEIRGRYVYQLRPGLWVKSWRGWALLDAIENDVLSIMVTLRFADGTASTVARVEAHLATLDHNPEENPS